MDHLIKSQQADKQTRYATLLPQIQAVAAAEPDTIARMANIAAMIYETFPLLWVGFYRVVGSQLVLGPFQGPMACTRIAYNKGVCGTAWAQERTLVVPDVEQFPGHIACSSRSRSEIVVPIFDVQRRVVAVLDIDSEQLSTFDDTDRHWIEKIASEVCPPQLGAK